MITTIHRATVETIDIELPGARACRVTLVRAPDGEPETVSLVCGWVAPFRSDGRGVEIPAHVLPALRAALQSLDGGR